MARAPYQVLVLPFRTTHVGGREYAVFWRADGAGWQGIAGGGEGDETPAEAARREFTEEAGVQPQHPLLALDSLASIPAHHFEAAAAWGPDVWAVPEYAFAVDATAQELTLSHEHGSLKWLSFLQALERLTWESNRAALRELERRLAAPDG